jgi:hypothetical protein
MVSAAVSCLPTAVSLLLLGALFMQISGVSLTLTWPCGLCLLRVLLCVSLCYKLSSFQALGKVTLHSLSQACVFICSSCGKWVFPPLLWSFPPSTTLTGFPTPGCWACPCSHRSLSCLPGLFIYSPGKDSLPPIFSAQCAPPSFPRVFIVLIAYYSVSLFFPRWRSVCLGGYSALAQACLWEYCGTAKLTLSTSSQAVWAWSTGGPGALLVSPFNVKWRFSVLAGGVEGSKFCLFSVILPAKCVSSVSPRFHYRRLAFCPLPLAAILESPLKYFLKESFVSGLGCTCVCVRCLCVFVWWL